MKAKSKNLNMDVVGNKCIIKNAEGEPSCILSKEEAKRLDLEYTVSGNTKKSKNFKSIKK